ncbi:family 20 glycosylhydrolase [Streptomyces sp. A7024]|uniref:Family 20 glycosylhydrolase n=1 Tax=Streptomyces coryli TaxID=1128680 RepID=A0A6G4TY98_9ACTN|nr:glycoside hydrolase family 20 protein [Streptomyces coryli]NGN64426.1 family 20 glycosylhydrolase [Streptomyces coryli]
MRHSRNWRQTRLGRALPGAALLRDHRPYVTWLAVALFLTVAAVAYAVEAGDPGRKSPAKAVPTAPDATGTGEAQDGADSGAPGAGVSTPPATKPVRAPRTVPAVRNFDAGGGPAWRPGPGTRVVAPGAGSLADESRRLAGELKVHRSDGPARTGDVELRLRPDQGGGPEAYRITNKDGRVTITAPDDAGVFYGTRTLLQALRGGALPPGTIDDAPDRAQRGLNLDIARKHFTADWIEARLHEMADLKLNQLGLHFSDDQAFRVESDKHPEIVSKEHLTKDEVRHLVKTAASLHITVVPEIDSPGHLGAVLDAHPDLQLKNVSGVPVRGAIDIANPRSAKLVDELLTEFEPLFPGPYWHLGGDEYRALMATDPEATYPALAAKAKAEYGPKAKVADLTAGWLNDRADLLKKDGKKLKAWNDGFTEGGQVATPKDREVEYWTGKEINAREPLPYLEEGRKVVNLNDEYLYYVLGEPNDFTYPTGKRIYEEWTPAVLRGSKPVPARYSDQILGARFAVWCDLADTQTTTQVAKGIQMPLAAMSQKVWDPRKPSASWADFKELAERVRP